MSQRKIYYLTALDDMRKRTPQGDLIPFSLGWFECGVNEGKYREEHGLTICGRLNDQLKRTHIDVRFDGDHHDTKIRIRNIYMFNGMQVHL
jgi:hypothetical protein